MLTLGLVGGIASGKSVVADCFRDLGAVVLDADRAGHAVLREPDVIAALKARWGERILDASGQVSRREVAKIVFAREDDSERQFLEQLTHPRIQMRLQQELAKAQAAEEPPRVVVLDAALLFEAGWERLCDKIIFVDAPRDVRLERAVARGWSAEQFAAREAAQLPALEKRRRADLVIRNVRTLENIRDVVRLTWNDLLGGKPRAG
ncbi:MAG TPA: dephospho-CoA kinase [Pirellulaceae bacterium]|nr:dephospho-CoA kinase [Pirellulaceae bacterium]